MCVCVNVQSKLKARLCNVFILFLTPGDVFCFAASEQTLSFVVSRPVKSADTVKKALSYREKKQAVKAQEEEKRRWERITILEVKKINRQLGSEKMSVVKLLTKQIA